MIFQPGMKVVCVDDNIPAALVKYYVALPVKGTTYTVRGIAPAVNIGGEDDVAVYLEGLHNPCSSTPPHRERGFRPERFAPLDELPEEQEEVRVGQFAPA